MASHNGSLYVGEISRITRFDNIESRLESPGEPVVVNDALPKDEHHGQKFIAFGPDGLLFIPVGAPCNICDKEKDDPRYASILRMKPDGSGVEVFPTACATPSASTGTRPRARCGSPTTAATILETTCRGMN